MGNQSDMFALYEAYPALTGEFVWDWKDQGLKMPLTKKRESFYWAYGGDFGDTPNDNSFCCNGVVLPDLTPTSKTFNMKKIYQPVDILLLDASTGTFKVKNKLQQVELKGYDLRYSIQEDGVEIKKGELPLPELAPSDSTEITIDLTGIQMKPSSEYHIIFRSAQLNDTPWASAGYEVATSHALLRGVERPRQFTPASAAVLTYTEKADKSVVIEGEKFSVTFAKGTLSQYVLNGKVMINKPLKLNTFRTPTENDKNQEGNWQNLGIRTLTLSAGDFTIHKDEENGFLDLEVKNNYTTSTQALKFQVIQRFRVYPDGTVSVSSAIAPSSTGQVIPRMGFRLEMPKDYEQITWFGCGPYDSYVDRKNVTFPSIYHSTVTDQWTHHIRPQETGNKEDVRWLAITSESGDGLVYSASQTMATTVGHWRAEELYTSRSNRVGHQHEYNFVDNTVVHLDAWNRALGNASCGPDVMAKYERRLPSQVSFSFMIMPLEKSLSDAELTEMACVGGPMTDPVTIGDDGKGFAVLSTTTPHATILYRLSEDDEYKVYTEPIDMRQGGMLYTVAQAVGLAQSIPTERRFSLFVNKREWSIVSFDSQQGGGELAINAIDDDESTIWHTSYSPNKPDCPHEIVVDMAHTWRVSAFTYKGRMDGSNGRVRDFEVYFSDNPQIWGEAAVRGTLQNNSDLQTIDIPSRPEGRYMKFLVRSVVDNQFYASAAEIGIQAETQLEDAEPSSSSPISFTHQYRIREKQSGLYLHREVNPTEGHLCLGKYDDSDSSYKFRFTQANGFRNFFKLRVGSYYVGRDAENDKSWRVSTSTTAGTDGNGLTQVEQLPDGTVKLRAGWQTNRWLNFDHRTVGGYVYSDKASGAIFILEDLTTGIEGATSANQLMLRQDSSELYIETPSNALLHIYTLEGKMVSNLRIVGQTYLPLNLQKGTYLITLSCGDERRMIKSVVI